MKGYINANTKIKSDNPNNPEIMSPNEISDMIASYIEDNVEEIRGKLNEYSTEEQIVGKWIDGSNVYRKVVILNPSISFTNTSWKSTGISSKNIKTLINVSCYSNVGGYAPMLVAIDSGFITMQTPRNNTGAEQNVTCFIMDYIKTTD